MLEDKQLNEKYLQEPWGKFLKGIDMEPVHTESCARRVAEAAAAQLGIGADQEPNETYTAYSTNGEEYNDTSLTDCVSSWWETEAAAEGVQPGDTVEFFECTIEVPKVSEFLYLILDMLQENATEELHEFADGWLEPGTVEARTKLATELQVAVGNFIHGYLKERDLLPSFGRCVHGSTKVVTVKILNSNGYFEIVDTKDAGS